MKRVSLLFALFLCIMTTSVYGSWTVSHNKRAIYVNDRGNVKCQVCSNGVNLEVDYKDHKKHGYRLGKCEDSQKQKRHRRRKGHSDDDDNDDESTYTLGVRYGMVDRVTRAGYGVVYDTMSDGSINTYVNVSGTTLISKVVNNVHGLQTELVYYPNGNIQYNVSHVTFLNETDGRYVESNRLDGRMNFTVMKTVSGSLVVNRFTYDTLGNQTGYLRNQVASQSQINLYNKYFTGN